jgi:DnaK suppressor protein
MDGKTLEQIRETLLERRKSVGQKTERQTDGATDTEIDSPSTEIIDIAQGLEQSGRDATITEQSHRDLIAIEKALSKLSSGQFGICEECEREIPPRRLSVLPQARLCAHCQALEERLNSRRASSLSSRLR